MQFHNFTGSGLSEYTVFRRKLYNSAARACFSAIICGGGYGGTNPTGEGERQSKGRYFVLYAIINQF